jgi:hypothetical protein
MNGGHVMAKNIAVYGIYRNRSMVDAAVEDLKDAGFRSEDISVLFPDTQGTKEFAIEKETKAPEGATAGAGTGAVIGGALGWLTGIGLLAIPGLGPFIAAGPIVAALAGVGAGGVVGGIAGALIGMGIPEYEANRYEGRIKTGGILLSVHADDRDWKDKAKNILQRTGADDIGYKGEAKADYDKGDRPYHKKTKEQDRNRPYHEGPSRLDKGETLHTEDRSRVDEKEIAYPGDANAVDEGKTRHVPE